MRRRLPPLRPRLHVKRRLSPNSARRARLTKPPTGQKSPSRPRLSPDFANRAKPRKLNIRPRFPNKPRWSPTSAKGQRPRLPTPTQKSLGAARNIRNDRPRSHHRHADLHEAEFMAWLDGYAERFPEIAARGVARVPPAFRRSLIRG